MAEAAGLAIGAINLAGLFTTCVECIDYISLGRNHGRDYEMSMTKLLLLKARLSAGENLFWYHKRARRTLFYETAGWKSRTPLGSVL